MREQLRILSSNKTQPMLRLTYRDSVLALHPFEQARLQRAPQSIAEVSVPEFTVVFDPSSNHSIVPARKIPQVIRRGSMDAPVFDRVHHPAHRLHRRSRHALTKEFALGVLQGSHLEVISEKGEARRDVVPLKCVDVDNLRLFFVDGQAHFTHPSRQALPDSNSLAHPCAVNNNIVGIPFKRHATMRPVHPTIKGVMQE